MGAVCTGTAAQRHSSCQAARSQAKWRRPQEEEALPLAHSYEPSIIDGRWPWPMDKTQTRDLSGQKALSTTHLPLDPCACPLSPSLQLRQRHSAMHAAVTAGRALLLLLNRVLARIACSTSHGDYRGCGRGGLAFVTERRADPLLRPAMCRAPEPMLLALSRAWGQRCAGVRSSAGGQTGRGRGTSSRQFLHSTRLHRAVSTV